MYVYGNSLKTYRPSFCIVNTVSYIYIHIEICMLILLSICSMRACRLRTWVLRPRNKLLEELLRESAEAFGHEPRVKLDVEFGFRVWGLGV